MDLVSVLKYVLVVVSGLIIVSVLLQARSGGLGSMFGGTGGGGVYRAKRGMEAVLYNLTIIGGILFAVISIAIAVLSV